MADPSLTDIDTDPGQVPDPLRNMKAGDLIDEGQEPEERDDQEKDGQEPIQPRTYSQSYVKQLRRENAEARKRLEALEAVVKEREDAEKTEAEKEREARVAAEKERDDLKTHALRVEVAGELGLDLTAVQFLTGSTREEIEHRAEELAKLLKQGKPAASFDGGARPKVPPEPKSPEVEHNQFLLRAMGRSAES
jgi:hypothetical protein